MATPCRIVVRAIVLGEGLDPGLCGDACPTGALRASPQGLEVKPSLCVACVACMALCGPEKVRVLAEWSCG